MTVRPKRPIFADIAAARIGRRQAVAGIGVGAAAMALSGSLGMSLGARMALAAGGPSTLTFTEAERVIGAGLQVAPGYRAEVLIRWGDPVAADAPAFDPHALTADGQALQFGYNNDFIAYMPLPKGSTSADHGLLCVNNEFISAQLMWSGIPDAKATGKMTAAQVAVAMQANGHSIVEVRKRGGRWQVVTGSPYARRITATTPMGVAGPAAGHRRFRTRADHLGRSIIGTFANCAGGKTPWGTVLTCEENFQEYFGGDVEKSDQAAHHRRYGLAKRNRDPWHKFDDRFDVAKEPNEPNRFGWIVEIDPYDPRSRPVKRTALGRFKHEGAATWVDGTGRAVVYSGDDEEFQCLYRFVTTGRYDPGNEAANRDLLDTGTLSVARFEDDGTMRWLPLVFGRSPLTSANGFESQGDVVIEARRAAELVGATPMDRPEDVEVNPVNGRVYVMLTKNNKRSESDADAANPRGPNPFGHILELLPPGADGSRNHGAESYRWELFLMAGDPSAAGSGAAYHPALSDRGWLAMPDNCAFDPKGRLWIATDQGNDQLKNRIPDGLYGCDVDGAGRALTRFFFGCPRGAELCGPEFTPDGRTLFVAVQHPGGEKGSSFEAPSTRWPDFDPDTPPRPAVVAITKADGGMIGD
jgi:secreted PhoX family phosphatase